MTDVLRIEDDDGFVTEHPWPGGRSLLANGDFVALAVARHDAAREARTRRRWRRR